MLQSLHALLHQNPGFDAGHLLTFSVNLPDNSYPSAKEYPGDSPAARLFEHEFSDRLRSLPGVQGVAVTSALPIGNVGGTIRFVVQGRPTAAGQEDECDIMTVTPSYFTALKVPVISGRNFSATDTFEAPWVAIVNRAFASRYFPNEEAVGKRIRFTFNAKEPYREIVGVVGNVAQDDLAGPPTPAIYAANDQGPSTYLTYMIRTAGDPAAFVGTAQAALHEMDAQLPLIQPQTMEQFTDRSAGSFSAALSFVFNREFCGVGADSGDDWIVWADFVYGGAAHAGDRDSHGAGSAAARYFGNDYAAGDWGGAGWRGRGSGGGIGVDAIDEQLAFWC